MVPDRFEGKDPGTVSATSADPVGSIGPFFGVVSAYRHARTDRGLRRDSDAMALTVALALLIALSAGEDSAPHTKLDVLIVVWATTLGLALTHWFAMIVASRLVSDRSVHISPLESVISQTVMALVVATLATATVLMLSTRFDRLGARVAAVLFIGALALFETRRSGLSTAQRVLLSVTVTLLGMGIAVAKWLIS